jgi:hypothetical protein
LKIPKGTAEAPNQRTDNVMTKRKKDTKGGSRSSKSEDRQCNDQKEKKINIGPQNTT